MEKEDEAIVGRIYGVIIKIAEEKGFKETDVEKIINDIEEEKMKYCDSYFKPKFDKDEGR